VNFPKAGEKTVATVSDELIIATIVNIVIIKTIIGAIISMIIGMIFVVIIGMIERDLVSSMSDQRQPIVSR
jgi:hypothetical protein